MTEPKLLTMDGKTVREWLYDRLYMELSNREAAMSISAVLAPPLETLITSQIELAANVARGKLTYPRACGLCPGTIESADDLDWHGLGNCVPICDVCHGSVWLGRIRNPFWWVLVAIACFVDSIAWRKM